jgi:hypothetical protein
MHRAPYEAMHNVFIVVPIDVTGSGHLTPRYLGMTRLQSRGQATRSLRDDLEASGGRIKRPHIREETIVIKSIDEVVGEIDIEKDTG